MIKDHLFSNCFKEYRIFKDDNLQLEWTPDGLKITKNKKNAVLKDIDNEQQIISLNEGEVIQWRILSKAVYSIIRQGELLCTYRVFEYNSTRWLYKEIEGETNADIMQQTAIALEDTYGRSKLMDDIKKCLEYAEKKIPEGVNDELRQKVINRWQQKQKKMAAAICVNKDSGEKDLRDVFCIFKQDFF